MRLPEESRLRTKTFASKIERSDAELFSKPDGLPHEADETQLWIELLVDDCGLDDAALPELYKESTEPLAIYHSDSC